MTDLIRWEDSPVSKGVLGYVGAHEPWAFQIWHTGSGRKPWELIAQLPGVNDRPHASDPDELRALAEHVLREFAYPLGALFAADLREHLERSAATEQELGEDYADEADEAGWRRAYEHWGAARAFRETVKHIDRELEVRQ